MIMMYAVTVDILTQVPAGGGKVYLTENNVAESFCHIADIVLRQGAKRGTRMFDIA